MLPWCWKANDVSSFVERRGQLSRRQCPLWKHGLYSARIIDCHQTWGYQLNWMDNHDSKVVKSKESGPACFFSTTKPHPAEDQTQHSWKLPRSKRWEDHPGQILSYSELLANLWVASFHPYGQCSHSWQATSAPLLQPQTNVFMPSVYPHIVKVCHKNTFKVGWTNTPTTSHQTCVRRPTVQMVAGCDWSHSTRHLGRWSSLVRKSGPATSKWNGDSSKHCDFTNKTCLFYKKDIVIFIIRSDDLTKKYDFAGNKGDVNNKMVSLPANNAFTNRTTGNSCKTVGF